MRILRCEVQGFPSLDTSSRLVSGAQRTTLREIDAPGPRPILELGFDAMFPVVIEELSLITFAHEVPCLWCHLLLDQVDKILVKKDSSAETACSD